MRILAAILSGGGLALIVSGCSSSNVQAPYDSFVCLRTSYNGCLAAAQSGNLKKYYEAAYSPAFRAKMMGPAHPEGATEATSDGAYSCNYGKVPYSPSLNMSSTHAAVFVSPILLSQIEEQRLRVDQSRESCSRLLSAYNYQLQILVLQDKLAVQQEGIVKYSSEMEHERNVQATVGKNPDQNGYYLSRYSLADTDTISSDLLILRERQADKQEEIRNVSKKRTLEVDYGKMFSDAQLLIDGTLRELGRDNFLLDRSTFDSTLPYKPTHYASGSWVEKGTVVLKTREAPK
jgi:hypothetical protein